jgi:hypothetical protein
MYNPALSLSLSLSLSFLQNLSFAVVVAHGKFCEKHKERERVRGNKKDKEAV